MNFSPQEQLVLDRILLNRQDGIAEISSSTKLRSHTVRYIIKKLKDRRIISPRLYLNLFCLGLHEYAVYLRVSGSTSQRMDFISYIQKADRVNWFIEVCGDYDFAFSVYTPDLIHFREFMASMPSQFDTFVVEKAVIATQSVIDFSCSSQETEKGVNFSYGLSNERGPLDEIDHKILQAVSALPDAGAPQLSRLTQIASSTIEYRIARLKSRGILVGIQYLIEHENARLQAYRLVLVAKRFRTEIERKLRTYCHSQPRIYFLVHTLGNWDFEIGVLSKDPHEPVQIKERILSLLGDDILSIRINLDARLIKLAPYPFSTNPLLSNGSNAEAQPTRKIAAT